MGKLNNIFKSIYRYDEKYECASSKNGQSYLKIYGLFREKDGEIYGLVENSFSLSWSKEFVAILSFNHAQNGLNQYRQKDDCKGYKFFIARLSAFPKPSKRNYIYFNIELWKERLISSKYNKYFRRNAPFMVIKDHEHFLQIQQNKQNTTCGGDL